jgi:hypothetical protein
MATPRALFNSTMRYERPERMFNWNWIYGLYGSPGEGGGGTQFWQQTIDRWHREGLPADVASPKLINDFFGVDRRLHLNFRHRVWPLWEPVVLEETDRYQIVQQTEGCIVKQFKGIDLETSVPVHLRRPVTSRQEWKKFARERLDPDAPGRERFSIWVDGMTLIESAPGRPNFQEARRLLLDSELPVEANIGTMYAALREMMGTTGLGYALYDDPALVAEMAEHTADLIIAVIERILDPLDVPIDHAYWAEDLAFRSGPLVAPKHVESLMVPHYRRVNDELRKRGIDVIGVDSDGNLDLLIPLWLESGINCVFPCEVAAGNDVSAMRKKYGRDLLMIGGIDKRALAHGEAAIEEELARRLPLVADGGYLPAVDHSVPYDISFENYMYYAARQTQQCAGYVDQWRG